VTIRRRITVAAAVAVGVAVVVISLGAFLAARHQLLTPIDDSLARRAEAIGRVPAGDLGRRLRPNGSVFLPGRPGEFDVVYYQIGFPNGSTVNIGTGLVLPEPRGRDLRADRISFRSVRVDDVHLRVATVYQQDEDVYVQLGRSLEEADQTLRRFAAMLLIGGGLGIAVAIGLGVLVSRNAVRPIEDLRRAISGITETGSLGTRLDVVGDDEVAGLASAFNGLLTQLEASKEQQVRLVRDAGHELRTPLTALRMNLEILQRHEVAADERATMLEAAHAEVEELSVLVAEIVDLATDRYEEEQVADVDLTDVAGVVVERLRRRNGREVDVVSDGSVVRGKRDALDRALSNIIANADAWTPADGAITVEILDGTVTVTDTGPGIPARDLPHVFERFYRSDVARSKPGSGLGLSIVEQIVADHGGEVFARGGEHAHGAVVGFRIPRS
jgi:two-component system, OmpR family, sensor histidine kinase MprB